MKTLRVGIAGGCLNTGFGLVPLNSVYHRVLARTIKEQDGIRLRVHLGNLESPDPVDHLRETDRLLGMKNLDAFIYQVRPEFLWMLSTLFWKLRDRSGAGSIRINSYKKGESGWSLAEPLARVIGKWRRVNWALARASGAARTGWNCLQETLAEVKRRCDSRGTPLAILGPVGGPWYLDKFLDFMACDLRKILAELGLPCIDLRALDRRLEPDCWLVDGRHVSARGHARIAELALPIVRAWMDAQLNAGAQEETERTES